MHHFCLSYTEHLNMCLEVNINRSHVNSGVLEKVRAEQTFQKVEMQKKKWISVVERKILSGKFLWGFDWMEYRGCFPRCHSCQVNLALPG